MAEVELFANLAEPIDNDSCCRRRRHRTRIGFEFVSLDTDFVQLSKHVFAALNNLGHVLKYMSTGDALPRHWHRRRLRHGTGDDQGEFNAAIDGDNGFLPQFGDGYHEIIDCVVQVFVGDTYFRQERGERGPTGDGGASGYEFVCGGHSCACAYPCVCGCG